MEDNLVLVKGVINPYSFSTEGMEGATIRAGLLNQLKQRLVTKSEGAGVTLLPDDKFMVTFSANDSDLVVVPGTAYLVLELTWEGETEKEFLIPLTVTPNYL